MDAKYDIFRKLPDGQPVWMKAVVGLQDAKYELVQMAKLFPGDYFIFDTRNGSVISAERDAFISLAQQIGVNVSD